MTLERTNISLNGLSWEAHIVPDSFPIDTDGLLGWDMLTQHKGRINAANRCLELDQSVVPFEKDEEFVRPPKMRQVIYARIQNMDEKIGFVPLQNVGPGLLFGNFVAENKEGKAHALCLYAL